MSDLNLDVLRSAVQGRTVAIRVRTKLEPIGGAHDKIFPPTFGDEMYLPEPLDLSTDRNPLPRHRTKYALEWRRIEGKSVLCVLLDSVASQANRLELSLLDGWNEGSLKFPLVRVDFTGLTHEDSAQDLSRLGGDGYLTTLELPHRLSDALLRDSMFEDEPFRASKHGVWYTEASPHDATAVYALCPTALIFGVWDSTGPKGGLGSKFQRALSSEIMGIGVELGVKTSSRIDPAGIQLVDIYEAEDSDQEWTTDVDAAKKKAGKAVLFKRGSDKSGKPSVINHGNIKPGTESVAGGVTVDYAEQVSVLSLPALRRLRFPKNVAGESMGIEQQKMAEVAARTALAALALVAQVKQRRNAYDLRSRCALRALSSLSFEFLPEDGSEIKTFTLTEHDAERLLFDACAEAEKQGMGWSATPIDLLPAPKMVDLIRRSRELGGGDDK